MRLGLTGDSVDPGNCSIMHLSCCENVIRMLLRGSDYAEAMMPDARQDEAGSTGCWMCCRYEVMRCRAGSIECGMRGCEDTGYMMLKEQG